MVTSSDEDDFEAFLSGIDSEINELGLPPPKPKVKIVECFFCRDRFELPVSYRLRNTCPPCYKKLRDHFLKHEKVRPWIWD